MSDVVSTRFDKQDVEELNRISENEQIDRSTLIRKFVLLQMKEYRMRDCAEHYRKGLMSLAESATVAKVSIYEMMDYLQKEKIQPPSQTEEEIEKDFDDSLKEIENLKK